jgi:hypothetical protein
MTNKSCFNCKHIHTWDYPASWDDPGDQGWECNHPDNGSFPYEEPSPDPECSSCKGTGFTDRDTGASVDVSAVYAAGGFVDAVECGCIPEEDEELAQHNARNCPGFEFFDWNADYKAQAEAEAKYLEESTLTPEQEEDLRQISEAAETQRLIEIGHLTHDGEPTPEFYAAADFAYDCYRERG